MHKEPGLRIPRAPVSSEVENTLRLLLWGCGTAIIPAVYRSVPGIT